jgi:hypothetical protein
LALGARHPQKKAYYGGRNMSNLENMINNRLVELARFEKVEKIEKELIEFGFIKKEKHLECPENILYFYFNIKLLPNVIEIEKNYKDKGEWFFDDEFIKLDYEEDVENIVKQIISMLEEIIEATSMLYV